MEANIEKTQDDAIENLFNIGAHLAYTRTRRHPSVEPFIFGRKNRNDIIDLKKTQESLEKALTYVKKISSEGKKILLVGTKPEARDALIKTAESIGALNVTERWIGGLLTNFSEVKKRIARLIEIKEKKTKGELDVYTKREQGLIEKELKDLEKKFGGVEKMEALPDALFVVDSLYEDIAVEEARKIGIPIISISSSDCDISKIDYPIVANDSSIKSITFFLEKLGEAYKEGVK